MLTETPEGVLLEIRAYPGARRNEIRGVQNGELKVSVTQQPEKGKANKAIVKQLANSLNIKVSHSDLVSGETSQTKKILLRNIKINEIKNQIEKIIQ
jgi:uncharacterized protein (TIGR00251 family)